MDSKPLDPEVEKILKALLLGIDSFASRETEDCPRCGNHVDRVDEIGRSLYARPCNCRLWQGRVPAAWKGNS